jgi:hypothetical protein
VDIDFSEYYLNNYLTVQGVGNIVFNETRSLSGDKIQDARKNIAHSIFNADTKFGNKRDDVAGTAPTTVNRKSAAGSAPITVNVPEAENGIYTQSQQAARNAYAEQNRGYDPTHGATNFNFRNSDSRAAFQSLSISTQVGPFNNSYPTKDLNATGVYSNTYGGKNR